MARAIHLKITAAFGITGALLTGSRIPAQEPAPPGVNLADFAARRHPQLVRVGELLHRRVLQPLESRPVLGHVMQVMRRGGTEAIIMNFGGWFGFGGRAIAVPVSAVTLLGSELEIIDFTPAELDKFPTYDGAGDPVAADEFIRMGLARPSH